MCLAFISYQLKITQNTLTKISFSPKNRNLETEKNKAIKTPRKISIQKPVWLNGQTRPRCHKGMQMAAVPTAPVRRGACMMPRVGPLINIDLHGLQVQGLRVYGVCSHDSNTGIVSRLGNKGALYPSMCLFGVRLLLRSSKRDKKTKKNCLYKHNDNEDLLAAGVMAFLGRVSRRLSTCGIARTHIATS